MKATVDFPLPAPAVPSAAIDASAMANAWASADPRFNVKQSDRAGVSRGRGAYAQAGIAAANNLANGIADAYTQHLQDAKTYADANLRLGRGQEQYAQTLAGLMSQATGDAQSDAMQRRNALFGLMASY